MLEKLKEVIGQRKIVSFFVLLLITTAVPLTVLVAQRVQNVQQKAAEKETKTKQQLPKFVAGEVIVKLKPQVQQLRVKKEEVQKGADIEKQPLTLSVLDQESIPDAIERLNSKYQIKKVEKIFKGYTSPQEELKKIKITMQAQNAQPQAIDEQKFLSNDLSRVYTVSLDESTPVEEVAKELSKSQEIEYAEPNHLYYTNQTMPNDPDFNKLWGLHNTGQTGGANDADIDAPEAWAINTNSSQVTVSVIDTGIDYNHEDLTSNIWLNTNEITNNAIDDDNNGYTDDVRGWDFVNNDNNPMDENGHGTHVAGTIGAVGNNGKGVVGVSRHVKLMPLRFLGANGSGSATNAAKAVYYATLMGAKVTNNSWGGGAYNQTLFNAIQEANAAGSLFVAAAGNSSKDTDTGAQYPAGYDLPNIISVAATDHNDSLAYFSNYGQNSVDISAPGVGILSTVPFANKLGCSNQQPPPQNPNYCAISGTSMAAPHVAGAAALVFAKFPNLPALRIRQILLSTTDAIPLLGGKVATGGRLNVYNAVTANDFLYSPKQLHVTVDRNTVVTRKVSLTNNGQQNITWAASSSVSWATINRASGTINPLSDTVLDITIDTHSLSTGEHEAMISLTTSSGTSSQFTIPILVRVKPKYQLSWGKAIGGANEDTVVGSARDATGNTYILRNTNTQSSQSIISLAKYNNKGEAIWEKQTVPSESFYSASATDIAIDNNSNIYIGGYFYKSLTFDDKTITGSDNEEGFIAKFDTSGQVLWLRKLPIRPNAIATDREDNYYIGSNNDLTKYDQLGNQQWSKNIVGTQDIVVDQNNTIYTTGLYPLAKHSSQGDLIYKKEDISKFGLGNQITLDAIGNIYITGYYTFYCNDSLDPPCKYGMLTAKYNPEGSLIWKTPMGFYGESQNEYGDSITVDREGNVYVAGRWGGLTYCGDFCSYSGIKVFFTIFDSTGKLLFVNGMSSSTSYDDTVVAIHVDSLKNIYVIGDFKTYIYYNNSDRINSNGERDVFFFKLKLDAPVIIPIPQNPGKAVYFGENNTTISFEDVNNQLVLQPNSTLELWVKPQFVPTNFGGQLIIERNTASPANDRGFQLSYNYVLDRFSQPTGYVKFYYDGLYSRETAPINQWAHLAIVRKDTNIHFFLNGTLQFTLNLIPNNPIPANPSGPLKMGGSPIGQFTNLQMKGNIDEVRLSNVARDIEAEWEAGTYFAPLNIDSSTIALWRFENNLQDSGTNQLHGTANGNIAYQEGIIPIEQISPTPTPASVCNVCSADVNKDKRVSVTDYSLMVSCYDQQGIGRCLNADINKTGTIDIEDIGCVINQFGQTCSQ